MSNIKNFLENIDFKNIISKQVSEIFDEVSLEIQKNKAKLYMSSQKDSHEIIEGLKVRPSLLVELANYFKCKNIAEVGTAQGLQSISFAKCVKESKVYTCDIIDDRKNLFHEFSNLFFVKGDSKEMYKKIKSQDSLIDLFWIDGAHDHYSVITDFLNLLKVSHKDTIWIFDDFDNRFGCFYDISTLINASEESVVIDLGKTASGNPNKIVVCKGLK